MSPIQVTIIDPLDPMGPKMGGSVSFIRGFVQHAPAEFELRFIGVTCDPARRPPGRWTKQRVGGREFLFLPLFAEADEDRLRRIPLALRFVLRFNGRVTGGDSAVLIHNRPETALAMGVRSHPNLVFIHNDIAAQIGSRASEVR